jgi:hypothetical protein
VQLANCGITAKKFVDGGHVMPGPVIPRIVFSHMTLTAALQKVSSMASNTTAYGWYVDENRQLHFYNQGQAEPSNVFITDAPKTSSKLSYSRAHLDLNSVKYDFDGQSLYNRAIVVGATTTIRPRPLRKKNATSPTDRWKSTGAQASWPLSYSPDVRSVAPVIVVNGTLTNVSYNDGTAVPTTPWMIQQAPNGTWHLQVNIPGGGSIPPAGADIILWYPYQTTITAKADNHKSQLAIGGPNGGVFTKGINQRNITSASGAYQRAKREITEFGHPQERISFTITEAWAGVFRAGQTFYLRSNLLLDSQNKFTAPLNATFIITQATVNITSDGFRTWDISAVRIV